MSVQFYWIPGPLANYGTTENGFKGEVRVVSVADFQLVTHANEVQAQEIHSLRADIVDLIAEVARLQRLIQMASDTGDLYERKLDAHETAIGSLRSRLAEAEALLRVAQRSCDKETAACIDAFLAADSAEAALCKYCHGTGTMRVIHSAHDEEFAPCWCVTDKSNV